MTYPLVLELADEGIPVWLTRGVLGFSPQGFYTCRRSPICARDLRDAHLVNAIVDIHRDDPAFGYRFIADELEAAGHQTSENRVHRLCRAHRIWSTTKKGGRHSKVPGPPVADDLVNQDFSAPAPDRTWLTDITEHPTAQGKLYCCCVKDVFSNRIVGYATGERMTASLATSALRWASAARHGGAPFGQGRPVSFQGLPGASSGARAQRLTGPSGLAGDNAAMESFYALLQKNVLDHKRWASRDELSTAIIIGSSTTYNRRRRQRSLGRLTPVEYELAFAQRSPQTA